MKWIVGHQKHIRKRSRSVDITCRIITHVFEICERLTRISFVKSPRFWRQMIIWRHVLRSRESLRNYFQRMLLLNNLHERGSYDFTAVVIKVQKWTFFQIFDPEKSALHHFAVLKAASDPWEQSVLGICLRSKNWCSNKFPSLPIDPLCDNHVRGEAELNNDPSTRP